MHAAAPLQPRPQPVDLEQYHVRKQARAGGLINEYRLAARRGRVFGTHNVRVLPPELLRTLPEWRALVLRTNLSPVIVRLRMAWRRWDYRRARQADLVPKLPTPILITGQSLHIDRGPQTDPQGNDRPDPPPLPPSSGGDTDPGPHRPRRPWDPPAKPENGPPPGFGDDQ